MTGDDDLFEMVHRQLHGQPARRDGEFHADCPFCGKEATRGQTHFSYSARGGHCFVCGGGGGLHAMARHLGLLDADAKPRVPAVRPPPPPPPPPPPWRSWDRAAYMDRYYPSATRVLAVWRASGYNKPVNASDVARHWLGHGVLPGGHEERLIVPIFGVDGRLACIRGRLPNGSGWMSPAGWKLADLPLFNARRIQPGSTVVIVENAVDAVLLSRHYEEQAACAVAVATLSATYWNSLWEDALLAARPARALVVFDNDLAGNGISDADQRRATVEQWQTEKGHPPPPARGPMVAARLNRRGLQTRVYQYPAGTPTGADPGDFIKAIMSGAASAEETEHAR